MKYTIIIILLLVLLLISIVVIIIVVKKKKENRLNMLKLKNLAMDQTIYSDDDMFQKYVLDPIIANASYFRFLWDSVSNRQLFPKTQSTYDNLKLYMPGTCPGDKYSYKKPGDANNTPFSAENIFYLSIYDTDVNLAAITMQYARYDAIDNTYDKRCSTDTFIKCCLDDNAHTDGWYSSSGMQKGHLVSDNEMKRLNCKIDAAGNDKSCNCTAMSQCNLAPMNRPFNADDWSNKVEKISVQCIASSDCIIYTGPLFTKNYNSKPAYGIKCNSLSDLTGPGSSISKNDLRDVDFYSNPTEAEDKYIPRIANAFFKIIIKTDATKDCRSIIMTHENPNSDFAGSNGNTVQDTLANPGYTYGRIYDNLDNKGIRLISTGSLNHKIWNSPC
jgi:hypothetical protein